MEFLRQAEVIQWKDGEYKTIKENSVDDEYTYLFIDYLLRGDVMAKIINNYPYYNVNIAAEEYLPSSYLNNPITNIDNDIFVAVGIEAI